MLRSRFYDRNPEYELLVREQIADATLLWLSHVIELSVNNSSHASHSLPRLQTSAFADDSHRQFTCGKQLLVRYLP